MSEKDPLGMKYFERSENAIAIIAAMLGRNLRQIMGEEKKVPADSKKLKELYDEENKYLSEREAVYSGDAAVQERVIREYSPLLLANGTD